MDGLFIVIAIVIGIFEFAARQQKKQGGSKRPQNTARKQMNIPRTLRDVMAELEKSMSEGMRDTVEQKPMPAAVDDYEGIEFEDRSRIGSLKYVEQSSSSEGICDEHPEHKQQDRNNRLAANEAMPEEAKDGFAFDLTEENLLKSIVMAEVLGPPRAIKRRIR